MKVLKLSLPGNISNKIVKAIAEFNLIEEGDHILVGLSGGKDSSFLLYALAILRKHLAIDFQLSAITIDPGFEVNNFDYLRWLCNELEVPYHVEKTEIATYIRSVEEGTPCAKCAHFRRGALVEYMRANNIKKVAFGHHYDDAVETFLMSILYSGQILTLQPARYLSENDIYIIRPLIYLREKYIIEYRKLFDYQPIENPCPFDKKTKRAEIKEQLQSYTRNKQIFFNLAAAMREGAPLELWPAKPQEELVAGKMKELWFGKELAGVE
ncbi:MAG: tRNA 2-thiocytidine biosynthesis TtcA family protein [Halanaerobiales bacterium]